MLIPGYLNVFVICSTFTSCKVVFCFWFSYQYCFVLCFFFSLVLIIHLNYPSLLFLLVVFTPICLLLVSCPILLWFSFFSFCFARLVLLIFLFLLFFFCMSCSIFCSCSWFPPPSYAYSSRSCYYPPSSFSNWFSSYSYFSCSCFNSNRGYFPPFHSISTLVQFCFFFYSNDFFVLIPYSLSFYFLLFCIFSPCSCYYRQKFLQIVRFGGTSWGSIYFPT